MNTNLLRQGLNLRDFTYRLTVHLFSITNEYLSYLSIFTKILKLLQNYAKCVIFRKNTLKFLKLAKSR
jgi:hypothetical protein